MNYFIRETDGLKTHIVLCTDTESFHDEEKRWDVLDKTELVRVNFCEGRMIMKTVVFFTGYF